MGQMGVRVYPSMQWAEGPVTPWTGFQSIAGQIITDRRVTSHLHTFSDAFRHPLI